MTRISLHSPAKLNLFLKVLTKRSDGYHDLETIFERVDLCDDIRLTSVAGGRIEVFCDHPHVPTGPKNLVYRVAKALQSEFGITQGVKIHIRKRIPVAAGLAGGSSNAATTLLGLNQIWKLRLSKPQLLALGAQIGSDVPFFLHDTSWALGQGRGERISPLKVSAKFWHVIVVPQLKLYSKDVFGRLNLKLTKKEADVNIFSLALKKRSADHIGQFLHNDLESSILSICPDLAKLKERLQKFDLLGVAFSGSGPACYGIASSQAQANAIAQTLRKRYSRVFAVRTL